MVTKKGAKVKEPGNTLPKQTGFLNKITLIKAILIPIITWVDAFLQGERREVFLLVKLSTDATMQWGLILFQGISNTLGIAIENKKHEMLPVCEELVAKYNREIILSGSYLVEKLEELRKTCK